MKTEIVVVIDKSGSMGTLANDVIGGYNSFLDEQIKNEIDANVSTLFFDTSLNWYERDVPLASAKKLNRDSYVPFGGTALNDAILRANAVLDFKSPERAVVVIITDGEENSSREAQPGAAKTAILNMQSKDYRVVFLAANQDAFKTGANYGVRQDAISNFDFNKKGIQGAFLTSASLASNYATKGAVGMSNAQAAYDNAVKTSV